MIKIQGENGIKITRLLESISELYYVNGSDALNLLINAITSKRVIDVIQTDIEEQLHLKEITK